MSISPETASDVALREALPDAYQDYLTSRWPGLRCLRLMVAEEVVLAAGESVAGQVTFADRILPPHLQTVDYMKSAMRLYDLTHTDSPTVNQRVGLRMARQERHRERRIVHYLTTRTIDGLPPDQRQQAAEHITQMTDGSLGDHIVRLVPDEAADRLRAHHLPEMANADWIVVDGLMLPPPDSGSPITEPQLLTIGLERGTSNRSMEGDAFWGPGRREGDGARLLLQQVGQRALGVGASQEMLQGFAGPGPA